MDKGSSHGFGWLLFFLSEGNRIDLVVGTLAPENALAMMAIFELLEEKGVERGMV